MLNIGFILSRDISNLSLSKPKNDEYLPKKSEGIISTSLNKVKIDI